MPANSNTKTRAQKGQWLMSALETIPSQYPLISLYPYPEKESKKFHLDIVLYIPDDCLPELLDSDMFKPLLGATNRGTSINLMGFTITYSYNQKNRDKPLYSMWAYKIECNAFDESEVDGFWVELIETDQGSGVKTKRGTVTMVATT